MCWKEIFPNEDAIRFKLVDELYTLPVKMPTTRYQFESWLEDWMTKLVAANEVSTPIEPTRAMAVLMNVGKPLQTTGNIFMTEWVAIFRESGLRDDVTIANLQEACLKLVVLAQAQAQELQVDMQVEQAHQPAITKTVSPTTKSKSHMTTQTDKPVCRFFLKPDGCENGDNCQYSHPRTNGKRLRYGSESHSLRPRPPDQTSLNPCSRKNIPKLKERQQKLNRLRLQPASSDKNKGNGKSKGKDKKHKPSAKTGDVDFDDAEQYGQDAEYDQAEGQDEQEDPEVYYADAQTSDSEVDFGVMPDWSARSARITKKVRLLL